MKILISMVGSILTGELLLEGMRYYISTYFCFEENKMVLPSMRNYLRKFYTIIFIEGFHTWSVCQIQSCIK